MDQAVDPYVILNVFLMSYSVISSMLVVVMVVGTLEDFMCGKIPSSRFSIARPCDVVVFQSFCSFQFCECISKLFVSFDCI